MSTRWKIAVENCMHYDASNFASQYKEAEQNPSHLLISRRENSATRCFSRGSPCLLRQLQKAAFGTLQLQNSHLLLSCLPLSLQNWVLLPGYVSTPIFQSLVKPHKGKSPFCELVLPQLDPQDRQRLNYRKKLICFPWEQDFLWFYIRCPQTLLTMQHTQFQAEGEKTYQTHLWRLSARSQYASVFWVFFHSFFASPLHHPRKQMLSVTHSQARS